VDYPHRRSDEGDLHAWVLVVILVVWWLAGFLVVQVGGALTHLFLVIAAIVLSRESKVVTGRRAL
jgi:hypothetical protein